MKKSAQSDLKQSQILFPEMKYTFADFFCGCGGLSLGFIQAGLKCISAMDFAPDAVATYWTNLCYKGWSHLYVSPDNEKGIKALRKCLGDGHTSNVLFPHGVPDNWLSVEEPMPCMSLFLYSILDIEPEDWMDMLGVRPGDISIFAGGPPCQGFSSANSSRNMYDKRNQLPLRYIHYAKVCRPNLVLMENVPGLLSLGKKKGDKEGPFIHWIRNAFDEAGYNMSYGVHNAADYGVPQNRKRVIFIAERKDVREHYVFPEPMYGDEPGKIPYVTVQEAIGHLPPIEAGEAWGEDVFHPYGYNYKEGYVICPRCFQYNKNERTRCHNCNYPLDEAIKGGVLRFPGMGTLIDTQKPIDNKLLRRVFQNKAK